jgi:hypothetical protein
MIEYEVLRKKADGTPNVPCVILGADSPATVSALLAYADAAQRLGVDPAEVEMARSKAKEFDEWRTANMSHPSDPDSPATTPA